MERLAVWNHSATVSRIKGVSTPPWKDSRPQQPVHSSKDQHPRADKGEGVVRVAVGIPVAVWRDEWRNDEEYVEAQVDEGDREKCLPGRGPVLGFAESEVDQAAGDEGVDPGAGVCVSTDVS
jgi:hypothetical protein